jgi:hypothetical protein
MDIAITSFFGPDRAARSRETVMPYPKACAPAFPDGTGRAAQDLQDRRSS